MPMKDMDSFQNRFRSSQPMPHRPHLMNDIQPSQPRRYPSVGASLPPRRVADIAPRTAPLRQQLVRPRQPMRTQSETLPPRLATPSFIHAPAIEPQKVSKRVKKKRLFTKKRIALLFLLLILASGGWFGFKFVYNVQKVFEGNVFSILTTTKLQGEDIGRVNILLAGNSADDPGHDGANLTDSIMVVSIDTKDNTAFMLSVPRDLWVAIPGYGHAKINEAYVDGQVGNFNQAGYPPGGMGLLAKVIQQNLGIATNYYALIDYSAVKQGVDAIGGIDLDIQSSDPRGLYDPSIDYATHGPLVKLTNGVHHLDGEQALDLARARGDAPGSYGFARSDFERTNNQRDMLLAIRSKVMTAGVLTNPITLSKLFDSVGQNVRTDFTLGEVRRLAELLKGINSTNIQSVGLDDAGGVDLLASYLTPTNEDALIPAAGVDDFTNIQAFVQRIMSNNPVVREDAKVVVLNGTSTNGLAAEKEKSLQGKDINVVGIGDTTAAATTTIIDASGGSKPGTLAALKSLFGNQVTTTNPYAGTYDADFIVVLGNDQVPPPSSPQTLQ